MNKLKLLILPYLLSPALALAQGGGNLTQTENLIRRAGRILTTLVIPIVFTLALLFFFWGVAKYIRSAGEEKEEGKKIMIWGVVGIAVMASIWGLVAWLQVEFLGTAQGSNINQQIPGVITNF